MTLSTVVLPKTFATIWRTNNESYNRRATVRSSTNTADRWRRQTQSFWDASGRGAVAGLPAVGNVIGVWPTCQTSQPNVRNASGTTIVGPETVGYVLKCGRCTVHFHNSHAEACSHKYDDYSPARHTYLASRLTVINEAVPPGRDLPIAHRAGWPLRVFLMRIPRTRNFW